MASKTHVHTHGLGFAASALSRLSIQRAQLTREGYRALATAIGESRTLNTVYVDNADPIIFEFFVQACHTRTIALQLGWQRRLEKQNVPPCADVRFVWNDTQTAAYQQAEIGRAHV